jgi:DNA-binding NarL/FixJ family response regulator
VTQFETRALALPAPVRVVVAEDCLLQRAGTARLLEDAGFDVVALAGDADAFLRKAIAHRADVAIVDVRMPPAWTDDGLRAAVELRRRRPETAVLVLSQYYEAAFALDLIGDRAEGVGYLLKERVGDLDTFLEAVNRVAGGGSVLDPEVVGRMLGRRSPDSPLELLTTREREVLAAMAEGKSNHGVAESLCVTEAAVEKHVTRIFNKFGLSPTSAEHRRVQAVLTFLRSIT